MFANGLRLAKIGASTEYYHYDTLGNVRLVTSGSNGNVLSTIAYKPFGLAVVISGTEPKYGYTGEYREATPNLVYLHSRWYDPTIGRFLSQDDRLGRLGMPQDQNRYAYVVNNPMAYTDPTGHDFLGDVWTAIVGIVTFPLSTVDWLLNRASSQETVGFFAGVLVALAVGIGIGFLCAATFGIGCAAIAILAGSLLGGVLASVTYWKVTEALGGTPTEEGLGQAFGWGMVAGGFGASLGFGWGMGARATSNAKGAAAEGKTAPEVGDFPKDPLKLQNRDAVWEDVSRPSQGEVLRSPVGGDVVELQHHGGHPLRPGEIYDPMHHGPHYKVGVRGTDPAFPGSVRWFGFAPGSKVPGWLQALLGGEK